MAKRPSEMTDAEYGQHIRRQSKAYYRRWKARQDVLLRKAAEKGIVVTDEEVDAELKRIAKQTK